jgi:hypothetical protein
LNSKSQKVTRKQTILQNFRYAPSVRCGTPHFALKNIYLNYDRALKSRTYAKASLLNARKTVKEAKKPVLSPIVWHVEAYERQS